MKGEFVIVRAFGDEPLVRRVWGADQDVVAITDAVQLQRLMSGGSGLTVYFRREDVFEYEPKAASKMQRLFKTGRKVDWRALQRWHG